MSIQQLMLGVGASKKTYMDDVFSTYVYTGTGSAQSINNGLDLSGKGGLVWTKTRSHNYQHFLIDTVRGNTKGLKSDTNAVEETKASNDGITSFNSNGYSLGVDSANPDGYANENNTTYASWSFRKAKGFFDVVTYTGDGGSSKTISHSLGSVPGVVIVKRTDSADNWNVYHRSTGEHKALPMNGTGYGEDDPKYWNDTAPTSTTFTVGNDDGVNADGGTYIAYVFAGGESTAATARSVEFDGSDDYLESSSSDYECGTGDFTIELWFKTDSGSTQRLFDRRTSGNNNEGTLSIYNDHLYWYAADGTAGVGSGYIRKGQWYHAAVVRHSSTTKLYLNGELVGTVSDTADYDSQTIRIAEDHANGYNFDGKISNFRLVVGTAVYTSSFKPPTEPLTNITNTKLLCCNNSSVTGKTTGGTITANSSPTASTDSPFDDPAAFTFGENGDQGIIKCGSYVGAGDDDIDVNLGWEPEWVLIKNTSETSNWLMLDSMRGIVSHANDERIYADKEDEAVTNGDHIDLTPTGFKVKQSTSSGQVVVYMAIRRPDGYVGKTAEAGTDVFAMDTGAGSSTIPNFDSGFPVDFQLALNPGGNDPRYVGARLIQGTLMYLNTNDAASGAGDHVYDSNVGWNKYSGWGSSYQSWMWKRHAGFDVVTWTGNGVAGRQIPHSLNNTAQMLWIKRRSGVNAWATGHIGLNGGTNPWNYYVGVNESSQETDDDGMFADTAPTSTHFTTGAHSQVNSSGEKYIAMLFASVDGISKVGSYTGTGAAWSGSEVTCGFQPRFIIIKRADGVRNWCVYDTLRGIDNQGGSSTEEKILFLNTNDAQDTAENITLSSTGFTFPGGSLNANASSGKYIFYAHA